MVEVKLYSGFRKRANSTLSPKGEGVTVQMLFKDASAIENPILIYQADNRAILYPWNYLYIPMLGYWYYINLRVSVRAGIWEFHCELDELATYKEEILNTEAYISRASLKYNPLLLDSFFDCEEKKGNLLSTVDCPVLDSSLEGSLILVCMSDTAPTTLGGMCGVFQTDMRNGALAMEGLRGLYDASQDLIDKIKKAYNSPFDAFRSCTWIPVRNGDLSSVGSERVTIGGFQFCNGYPVNRTNYTRGVVLTVPHKYDDFRSEEMCAYKIFLPCVGVAILDSSIMAAVDEITVVSSADFLGNVSYRVYTVIDGAEITMLTTAGNCSVTIPINIAAIGDGAGIISGLSETMLATGKFITGLGVGATFGATSPMVVGGLGATSMAIGLAKTTMSIDATRYMSTGNLGGSGSSGLAACTTQIKLTCEYRNSTSVSSDVLGRPVNATGLLSDYAGGYIKTANVSVNCAASQIIRMRLNEKIDGGIYLE